MQEVPWPSAEDLSHLGFFYPGYVPKNHCRKGLIGTEFMFEPLGGLIVIRVICLNSMVYIYIIS